MSWLFYALIGPVLWSLVNFADSYLVRKTEKTDSPIGSLVIFSSLIGLVVALLISLFAPGDFASIGSRGVWLLIASGFLNAAWIILYFYALQSDDVSAVIPWFLFIPVFGYLFGFLFLGETLHAHELLGGACILFGALILSFRKSTLSKIHFRSKTMFFMIPCAIIIALWGILFKYVAEGNSYWVSSFWEYLGLGIAGVIFFLGIRKYRNGFLGMIRNGGKMFLTVNAVNESLTIVGNLTTNFALLLAPVSLVYIVQTFQTAIVFILGLLGALYLPKLVHEDTGKKTLLFKFVAIGIMTIGSLILYN